MSFVAENLIKFVPRLLEQRLKELYVHATSEQNCKFGARLLLIEVRDSCM